MKNEIADFLENLKDIISKREEYSERINESEIINQLWIFPSFMKELNISLKEIETILEMIFNKNYLIQFENERMNLEDKLQTFERFLKSCGTPDRLLGNIENVDESIKLIMETIVSLRSIRNILEQIENELGKRERDSVFQGRRGTSSMSLLLDIHDRIRRSIKSIEEKTHYLSDIESILLRLTEPLVKKSESIPKDYAYIYNQLDAAMIRGIYCGQLVEILTGLKSITGNLEAGNIRFEIGDEEQEEGYQRMSMDELFYRYPPFEPIAVQRTSKIGKKISIPIAGNFVWFINSENFDLTTRRLIEERWRDNSIIEGESLPRGIYEEIREVRPIDILEIDNGEFIIKLLVEGFRRKRYYVRIKYGSRKLAELLRGKELQVLFPESQEERIQDIYEKKLGKIDKAYKFNDLTYVWYCISGYAMSTDPWDMNCPFKTECPRGRIIKAERCPYWSYSRRIFPKVFGVVRREIPELERFHQTSKIGMLTFFEERNVAVQELYKGVQWNMPTVFGAGIPVIINFKRTLVKSLPRTNLIGFAIPYSVVRTFVLELIDPENTPKDTIKISNKLTQTIDKLMLSKYFIWQSTERGQRTFSFLGKSKEEIINEYEKFVRELQMLQEEITEFYANVLAHTLAHLLYFFLIKELELQPRDLIYSKYIDKGRDTLYIVVAENSPLGVIDIIRSVEKKFGSVNEMLIKFIDEMIRLLDEHEEEIMKYSQETENNRKKYLKYLDIRGYSELKGIMEEIENYYKEFVDNGLILDLHTFFIHLCLNEVYRKISKKTKIKISVVLNELNDILQFVGPSHCVDGCTSCIMMESACVTPLSQNLELSRYLTSLFLKFFFKGNVNLTGKKLGETLLRKLPSKSIFIISPYLDDEGLRLLEEKCQSGIEVTLVTTDYTYEKYRNKLVNINDVYVTRVPRHEKLYIIDDMILINTTWNLTPQSRSTNRFQVKLLESQEIINMKQQILAGTRKSEDRENVSYL
ncbi:MAG: hypothetical protein QXS66_07575 [Thermoproteota archaeon]